MDQIALVSVYVERGAHIVEVLDEVGLRVNVGLWAYLSEYEDWRLVLAAKRLDSLKLQDAYGLIFQTLTPAGFTPANTPPLLILRMKDPFIRNLRRLFAKTKTVQGIRMGGQLIGDRLVQDGYVYRIS